MNKQLSVIVTHHRTPEMLELCLDSIRKSRRELDLEIFVLDSQFDDRTEETVKSKYPKVGYFGFEKNVGYAKLVNKGLKESNGRFVFIMNADIILEDGSLKKMLDYLENNSQTGMLGPQLLNFNGQVQDSCFAFYRPLTIFYRRTFLGKFPFGKKDLDRFLMKNYDRQSIREVDWLQGAAFMVRREAADEVGPMDERFFMYFEDVDWCRRFWQKGWKIVYFPEAKMHHYHGRFSKKGGFIGEVFNKYAWIHLISAGKYFWKWRGQEKNI